MHYESPRPWGVQLGADQPSYVDAEVRRFWATTLIPFTAVVLAITIGLVVAAIFWTEVDPAVAIPAGSTSPLAILAGIGFWTVVVFAANNIAFTSPTGTVVSLGTVPIVAAAALGGPLVAAWVTLVGATELREFRERPAAVVVWNRVGIVLPIIAAALVLEPLRPSLLDASAAVLSLGVTLAIGLLFLVGNTWLALWSNARFDARRVWPRFLQLLRAYTALLSLLPLAWLAAETYVHVGWWTVLVFACVISIWQFVASQDSLDRDANQDRLTSLLNRRGLERQLAKALASAERRHLRVGLAFLDLDGFKAVNDRFGHDAGDALLTMVAERLTLAVRPGDAVGRIGGDEFVVVLPAITGLDALAAVVDRLRTVVAAPCDLGGKQVQVSASIGTTLSGEDDVIDTAGLLARADAAMYREKAGRDRGVSRKPASARGDRRRPLARQGVTSAPRGESA